MKSYHALPFLAAAALAQDAPQPNCGIITQPDLDANYPAGARPIAVAIVAINETTVTLNQTIDAFDGSASAILNLQNAASAVLANIQQGNANVTGIPQNGDDDNGTAASFALVTYVGGLGCTVNATIDNLIAHRQALVDACVGPIVLDNVQQQQNASLTFEATVKDKISPSLQQFADTLVQPINDALSSAVSVFADQTALPSSCSTTTTSTTTATTTGTETGSVTDSATATATATATGSASGSGVVEPTGANGWSAIPYASGSAVASYGAQPTGTYGGDNNGEDCDEENPTGTYGGDNNEEEDCDEEYPTGSSGSYPTGGSNSYPTAGSGSYPTGGSASYPTGGSSNAAWAPIEYPTGSGYGSVPVPTGSDKTWEAVTVPGTGSPSKPTNYSPAENSFPAESEWQPVYTTAKGSVTTSGPYAKYTGAAVSNMANGIIVAAVAAIAAIAMM